MARRWLTITKLAKSMSDELFCHVVGSCASMGQAATRMEASQLKGAAASRRVSLRRSA